jgi:hypothetical protein
MGIGKFHLSGSRDLRGEFLYSRVRYISYEVYGVLGAFYEDLFLLSGENHKTFPMFSVVFDSKRYHYSVEHA